MIGAVEFTQALAFQPMDVRLQRIARTTTFKSYKLYANSQRERKTASIARHPTNHR